MVESLGVPELRDGFTPHASGHRAVELGERPRFVDRARALELIIRGLPNYGPPGTKALVDGDAVGGMGLVGAPAPPSGRER